MKVSEFKGRNTSALSRVVVAIRERRFFGWNDMVSVVRLAQAGARWEIEVRQKTPLARQGVPSQKTYDELVRAAVKANR